MNVAASVDSDDVNLFTIASLSQRKAARLHHTRKRARYETLKLRPHPAERNLVNKRNGRPEPAGCVWTCLEGCAFIGLRGAPFFCD